MPDAWQVRRPAQDESARHDRRGSRSVQSRRFVEALEQKDLGLLRAVPKSDLHCHADMAASRASFARVTGVALPAFPDRFDGLEPFFDFYRTQLRPHVTAAHLPLLEAALLDARADGVVVLEMSINMAERYLDPPDTLAGIARQLKSNSPKGLTLRPALGIRRPFDEHPGVIHEALMASIESGEFDTLDTYGAELMDDLVRLRPLYDAARERGMRLVAHAGEFSAPDTIGQTYDMLGVQEIQHGISAAKSKATMRQLRENRIQLNICPTSNVRLGAVRSLAEHPIRHLADAGISVTVNSDDPLVFDSPVSGEYLALFGAGLFSAGELDDIRLQGLRSRGTSD